MLFARKKSEPAYRDFLPHSPAPQVCMDVELGCYSREEMRKIRLSIQRAERGLDRITHNPLPGTIPNGFDDDMQRIRVRERRK